VTDPQTDTRIVTDAQGWFSWGGGTPQVRGLVPNEFLLSVTIHSFIHSFIFI